jgi:hypothetical protein
MCASLDDGYKAMAQDQSREAEAMEWTNGLTKAGRLAAEDAIKVQLGMPR